MDEEPIKNKKDQSRIVNLFLFKCMLVHSYMCLKCACVHGWVDGWGGCGMGGGDLKLRPNSPVICIKLTYLLSQSDQNNYVLLHVVVLCFLQVFRSSNYA